MIEQLPLKPIEALIFKRLKTACIQ